MEVVEVKRKPDETKKNTEPQESTRPAEEMKERAREGYFVRNPEADCVYCPGGATLYQKSIKKNGDTRYCNKKLCRQCPYKDKCVTSTKYPWKEIDFSKDCLEKKAKWWEGNNPGQMMTVERSRKRRPWIKRKSQASTTKVQLRNVNR